MISSLNFLAKISHLMANEIFWAASVFMAWGPHWKTFMAEKEPNVRPETSFFSDNRNRQLLLLEVHGSEVTDRNKLDLVNDLSWDQSSLTLHTSLYFCLNM